MLIFFLNLEFKLCLTILPVCKVRAVLRFSRFTCAQMRIAESPIIRCLLLRTAKRCHRM